MMKQVLIVAALVASASAFVAPVPARPAFVATSSLNAEWEKEWKETDFEGELKKLEKEAEERLDAKIAELQANIELTTSK